MTTVNFILGIVGFLVAIGAVLLIMSTAFAK